MIKIAKHMIKMGVPNVTQITTGMKMINTVVNNIV